MANFLQTTWHNVLRKSKEMDMHVNRYYRPVKALAKGTSFIVGGSVTLATSFFEVGVISINQLLSLPLIAGYKLLSLLTGVMVYEDISQIGNEDQAEYEVDNLVTDVDKSNLVYQLKYRAFAAKFFIKTGAEFAAYMALDGQSFITKHFLDRLDPHEPIENVEDLVGIHYIEELKQSIQKNGPRNLNLYKQALYKVLTQPLPLGIGNNVLSVTSRIGAALLGGILLAFASLIVATQALLNYVVKGIDTLAILAHTAVKLLLNAPLYLLSGLRYVIGTLSSLAQVLNSTSEDEGHGQAAASSVTHMHHLLANEAQGYEGDIEEDEGEEVVYPSISPFVARRLAAGPLAAGQPSQRRVKVSQAETLFNSHARASPSLTVQAHEDEIFEARDNSEHRGTEHRSVPSIGTGYDW